MALLSALWCMAQVKGVDRDECVDAVEDLQWVYEQSIVMLKEHDGDGIDEIDEEPACKRYLG